MSNQAIITNSEQRNNLGPVSAIPFPGPSINWWTHFAGSPINSFWMTCSILRIRTHTILVISFTCLHVCQYGESIESINSCSWWLCEIRLSNGVHSHRPGLGSGGLWRRILFSRYVYHIDVENVDTECAIWNKYVASGCKGIASLW